MTETLLSVLLIIIVIIVQGYVNELHNDSLYDDLVEKLEDLKSDNNDKQKPTTVDVDSMVESYKQRLWKNCKTTGDYAFVNACAAAFKEGVENTLDELDLISFINKNKEKQDKRKPTDIYPIFKVGDIIRHKKEGFTCKIIAVDTGYRLSECNGTYLPFDSQDAYELVKQNPADKVQPKFKVGNWIVEEGTGTWCIVELCATWYEVIDNEDNHRSISYSREDKLRLWTIEDAKEKDVLIDFCEDLKQPLIFMLKKFESVYFGLAKKSDYSSYCFLTANNKQAFKVGNYHHIHNISPATKEQRDLLFSKMKEAGYEWDDNNKVINKSKENDK